ncbi:hypothetical protein SUGI_0690890 [Cryptomeria japonica]|nr:hypothetical protein SUGI_0690890 [Cryptomeria japonica]
MILPRNGRSDKEWFSLFQKFLEALADRRRYRVQEWIRSNTLDICGSDEVKSLKLDANVALDDVKKGLSVCGCKCSDCFWRDLAGHEGAHDCKEKIHTCSEKSLDSNEVCSQRPGHHGQLKCKNSCTLEIKSTHRKHRCQRGSFDSSDVSEHYVDSRCQSCDYLFQRPIDQSGLHNTVHGNTRKVENISADKGINFQDRMHKWGEILVPNINCRKQGRGYNHPVPCPGFSKCTGNLDDGSRHKTAPQDVMTHETFWQYVSREEFDIQNLNSAGYITDDSRHFGCDQSKNVPHHVIFVIDKSRWMGFSDSTPTMIKFYTHKCRLGCVYEDILWFIRLRLKTVSDDSVSVFLFDESATVAIEMEDMKESVVDRLLQQKPGGGAIYSSRLDAAEKILIKGSRQPSVNVKMPVVIFLSDGVINGGEDPLYCVDKMKRAEPRMILHTIKFGTDPTTDIVIEMAKKGGGTFGKKLDEIPLVCGS